MSGRNFAISTDAAEARSDAAGGDRNDDLAPLGPASVIAPWRRRNTAPARWFRPKSTPGALRRSTLSLADESALPLRIAPCIPAVDHDAARRICGHLRHLRSPARASAGRRVGRFRAFGPAEGSRGLNSGRFIEQEGGALQGRAPALPLTAHFQVLFWLRAGSRPGSRPISGWPAGTSCTEPRFPAIPPARAGGRS